jgi:hypothetical protein
MCAAKSAGSADEQALAMVIRTVDAALTKVEAAEIASVIRAVDKHLDADEAGREEVSAFVKHLEQLTDAELRAFGGGAV